MVFMLGQRRVLLEELGQTCTIREVWRHPSPGPPARVREGTSRHLREAGHWAGRHSSHARHYVRRQLLALCQRLASSRPRQCYAGVGAHQQIFTETLASGRTHRSGLRPPKEGELARAQPEGSASLAKTAIAQPPKSRIYRRYEGGDLIRWCSFHMNAPHSDADLRNQQV